MARLRYAKTLDEVKRAHETNPEFLKSTVRSIRAVYETHPELVKAVIRVWIEATRPTGVCVASTTASARTHGPCATQTPSSVTSTTGEFSKISPPAARIPSARSPR